MKRALSTCILLALAACGGPRAAETTTASGEGAAEGSESESGGGRRQPLGRVTVVEGTGLSIRPPRGSERSAIGSSFVHPRRRMQVLVAATEGDLSTHQSLRTSLLAEAEEVEHEDLEIDGAQGMLIVDRLAQQGGELERVWVLVRKGTRSAAAMGVYAADRSETLRDLMRAVVTSLTVDAEQPLDSEVSTGWKLAHVEGLELVRSTSTDIVYTVAGGPPSDALQPQLYLRPLPIEVPESERVEICPQLLAQMVPVPEGQPIERGTIDSEGVSGCEVWVRTTEEPLQSSYFGLVFRDAGAFVVVGGASGAERDTWVERYREAARTLTQLPRGGAEEVSERPAAERESASDAAE